MFLFAAASPSATVHSELPGWLVWPCTLLCLAGAVGLLYSVLQLVRLYDPPENAFKFSASQLVFRFALTQPGEYELACARPGQWDRYFTLPTATLALRQLPAGPELLVRASTWSLMKRTNLSGETTLRLGTFVAPAPGEYELRNPDAANFKPGDNLRLLPAAGLKGFLLILAILLSSFALIGGFILALLAAQTLGQRLRH